MRFMPLALHTVLVVMVAMTQWLADDPVTTLTIGGILSLPVYLLLGWIETRRAPLGLSPLSFYFVWYSVCFGPSAIYMANRIDRGDIIGFSVTYVHATNLAPAYVIFLIGSLALHAGIQVLRPMPTSGAKAGGAREGSPSVQSAVSGEAGESRAPSAPVFGFALLWFAGVAVRLFGESLRFLGAALGVLNWAPLAGLCAYAIFRGTDKHRGPLFWLLLCFGMALELVFNLRTGSKAYIMFSFLPVLWLMAREKSLRRLLIPVSVGLVVFYIGLVAPVVSMSRRIRWGANESQTDRLVNTYMEDAYRDSTDLEEPINTFLDRQFDPIPVGFLHREVERTGLRYGDTMDYLFYAFIPRLIWADKPSVTRGGWFTLYLGQARTEAEISTSTGQTAIGELYWNFGLPGVVAGMGFLGMLIGGLWRMTRARAHENPLLFLLYISLCFGMLDMPEAGTVLVGLVYRALVVGTLVWVIRYIGQILPKVA